MVRYKPLWADRVSARRRPSWPAFRGETTADVVIVGGGLTGAACAYAFAAAGVQVLVLEADRVGAGATARSPGFIREEFDASFQETAATYGLRAARHLWQGQRRASLDLAAALRRLQVRCDLMPVDLVHVAPRDADGLRKFRREQQARRAAGLDHVWLSSAAVARSTGLEASGGIRSRGAVFDPYRACLGFAAAAEHRGAGLYERSPVRRIRTDRKQVAVSTRAGVVRAQAVLIATGAPLPDLRALRRHLRPRHAYAVVTEPLPAAVRREVGPRTAAIRDSASPPRFVRWLKDDRVLVAGADQPPVQPQSRPKVLAQRTGQLMYELSTLYPAISGTMPEWAWDFAYDDTVDGLPFVGRHRNFPRHLFALGHGRHGAAVAWLAARILLRQFQNQPAKGDELFGFGRVL